MTRRKWRRQWHPTPGLLPGRSHGQRSLVGCSPWGREKLDTTERLHFSLSCIEEGNGNPLQCFCLENPRDRGAWWPAVYGVAQSQTRLKQLSSNSSSSRISNVVSELMQFASIFLECLEREICGNDRFEVLILIILAIVNKSLIGDSLLNT